MHKQESPRELQRGTTGRGGAWESRAARGGWGLYTCCQLEPMRVRIKNQARDSNITTNAPLPRMPLGGETLCLLNSRWRSYRSLINYVHSKYGGLYRSVIYSVNRIALRPSNSKGDFKNAICQVMEMQGKYPYYRACCSAVITTMLWWIGGYH